MKITYGIGEDKIDVTDICLTRLQKNNIVTIPSGDDDRAVFFGDPLWGSKKKVFIEIAEIVLEYDDSYTIKIKDNTINALSDNDIDTKLNSIQSTLQLYHGGFDLEVPEQRMVVRYLTGNEKVLEIGGNIGRNSMIIGSILKQKNNTNFVVLESHTGIYNQLLENRDLNNLTFFVENSALSKRKLIQQGWNTIESDTVLDGYYSINTITLDELTKKYNIQFDTLVLDCEGAFYYILIDMPEILTNVQTIIMENDYWELSKKQYIDEVLEKNNFYRDYVECGGWGPCYSNFFEVWLKDTSSTSKSTSTT
jgi:FkbM family methyltransferase